VKNEILIAGSGFSGMWSAISAARAVSLAGREDDVNITIVSPSPNLHIRPRFYETAFDEMAPDIEPLLAAVGVKHLCGRVESVNTPAQLQEFDRVAAVGFGQPDADIVYSAPLLSDHRYGFYFIRHSNNVVAGIQTFTNNDSIGIYTLFTLPEFQQKGLATRLVEHALASEMNLPAITNPSDDSERIFEKAGFTNIGTRTIWLHAPD